MAERLLRSDASLYDTDFYAWTKDQAARLRAHLDNCGDIDWENAAEEIESLGWSEKREIKSRLVIVLLHLLKWRFQETHRSRGWKSSIVEQRKMLLRLLSENSSLAELPEMALAESYELARLEASAETGFGLSMFPKASPFTAAEALDPNFYPDGG